MADRTPAQEQSLIDAETRIGRISIALECSKDLRDRVDDTIRDTKHRRVMQAETRQADETKALRTEIADLGRERDRLQAQGGIFVERSASEYRLSKFHDRLGEHMKVPGDVDRQP